MSLHTDAETLIAVMSRHIIGLLPLTLQPEQTRTLLTYMSKLQQERDLAVDILKSRQRELEDFRLDKSWRENPERMGR